MRSVPRLDLADAQILLQGARTRADEIGMPMCIAITDDSGNLIAFERMDGGKVISTQVAVDKAYTAATIGKGTHEIGENAQPGNRPMGFQRQLRGGS